MKIVLTEGQYIKLLLSEGKNSSGKSVIINFTNFAPDQKWKKDYVYINGVSETEITDIKKLKENNLSVEVTLKNILTKETFVFPIEKINLTVSNKPYINMVEYEKIKGELEKHEIVLSNEFLKKSVSGFPKFIKNTLFSVYPNNIGRNSFIDGGGVCNSDEGLINIEGTNVPGQTWSILNFFDTNPKVIQQLIDWYHQDTFSNKEEGEVESIFNFRNWVDKNKEKLFKGPKLETLVKLNLTSYNEGLKNENYSIEHLIKPPYNIKRKDIKQFCAGSSQDIKEGKDLEVNTKRGLKYFQSKPLSWFKFNSETNEYIINTYFMKNYQSKKVDYIIFASKKDVYVFENKNYKVLNNHTVVFQNPPVTTI